MIRRRMRSIMRSSMYAAEFLATVLFFMGACTFIVWLIKSVDSQISRTAGIILTLILIWLAVTFIIDLCRERDRQ